ncbi:hypothetical protein E4T56_gene5002 [Termitomyces sp. T112]|nr:hypothetical protein E4T56_gene5002 [Termitomyces sp. T112]
MISAIKSINPTKFWKNIKNEVSAPISNPNIHIHTLNALDRLANRFDSERGGYHSVICGLFAYPATDNETTCKKILQKITHHRTEYEFDTAHEFFVIPSAPIIALTNPMPPFEGLKRLEEGIQRRVRDNLEKSKFTRKINGHKPRRRPTPASQHLLVKL